MERLLTKDLLSSPLLQEWSGQQSHQSRSKADLVVSLVPATLHADIARLAVKHKVHMVTASYVSPEMQALDEEAKAGSGWPLALRNP